MPARAACKTVSRGFSAACGTRTKKSSAHAATANVARSTSSTIRSPNSPINAEPQTGVRIVTSGPESERNPLAR